MILALSTAAAPLNGLKTIVEGCARRGLAGIHLVAGHAHGITLKTPLHVAENARDLAHAAGVRVVAIEAETLVDTSASTAVQLCALFGAALVTRCLCDVRDFAHWQRVFCDADVPLIQTVDLDASHENVAEVARSYLDNAAQPSHFTLRGGGPEAAQHEGRGIGAFMARLAVTNYQGVLALAPSSNAVRPVWNAWLQHGKSWGCGSKTADYSLVQLG